MMRNIFFGLVVFGISCFLVGPASAIGVGVKPTAINLSSWPYREVSTEILVMNVSDQPAVYHVYPDAFTQRIKIEPESFELLPQTNRLVMLKIKASHPGSLVTNISVLASPKIAGPGLVASGVKIPLVMKTSGENWLLVIILGILVVCFGWFFKVKLGHKIKSKN